MSDNEQENLKQTSSVPLKKETVRVTLKAADAPAASPTGAVPPPSVPKPSAAAPKPSAVAPKPSAGAPPVAATGPAQPPAGSAPAPTAAPKPPMPAGTAPKPSGGAPPAPAPTIPLRTTGGATGKAPAPAPTIKLNTTPAAGSPTVALKSPAGGGQPGQTAALPKATVQLNPPTQPTGAGGISVNKAAPVSQYDEEEAETTDTATNVLSIAAFVGAAAVLAIQAMIVSAWDGWGQLF